ncbi:MAG: methionine--tRNA ligase [Puniceicoccales bacterium]|jgi:methionyl-tRNA synthetase|nr:methionine--tRNA ligase [Puniceicoccales bacterium]
MKRFYLTTAIDYANGSPHLGHAYEKILADAIVRARRLEGVSCHFLTGLDEHGQKVQETAERLGRDPQLLCDGMAKEFQAMCQRMGVAYDDYIRTTEPRHREVVKDILRQLNRKGEIYKAVYGGLYSVRAERFVQEKDRIDGRWPEDFGEVIELEEENYFFRLSNYQDWLVDFLQKNSNFIFPAHRQRQVLEFLKEPLNDLCISRPKSRLHWGIEMPFDGDYVTYVWFDALINYISAVGYGTENFSNFWPADVHVIGKDILSPAHAVYWPIMLHALDLPLPRCLLAHGWWLAKGGAKMSKSEGNAVHPMDYADIYGSDAFRYFVLREMNVGQDSNFSHDLFVARYRADLANDLGNLLSRLVSMVDRYCGGTVPAPALDGDLEKELKSFAESTVAHVRERCGAYDFAGALERIFSLVQAANRYLECREPWKLAKGGPEEQKMLRDCLGSGVECLRIGAELLFPAMPAAVEKMLAQLGVERAGDWRVLAWGKSTAGKKIGKRTILFPPVEEEEDALPPLSA